MALTILVGTLCGVVCMLLVGGHVEAVINALENEVQR